MPDINKFVASVATTLERGHHGALAKNLIFGSKLFDSEEFRKALVDRGITTDVILRAFIRRSSPQREPDDVGITDAKRLMSLVKAKIFSPGEIKPLILMCKDPEGPLLFHKSFPDHISEDELTKAVSIEVLLQARKMAESIGLGKDKSLNKLAKGVPQISSLVDVQEVMDD